jgi:hypothetical protein
MASRIPLGRALAALAQADSRESRGEAQTRREATLAAYAWLERQPQGELILEDLALRLTTPCESLYDEGGRRLVLTIFQAIADGKKVQERGSDGRA